MKKFLKWFGIALVVLLAAVVLVAGYYGFVPGLSKLMGSSKPRDLGVKHTVEDAYKASDVMGAPLTREDLQRALKDPDSLKKFDASLSNEQVSSSITVAQSDIPNFPIYLVQIKVGAGGTTEASGMIRVANVRPFLADVGVSAEDSEKVIDRLSLFSDMPFYVKGNCSVAQNACSLQVSQLEIGRFTVPGGWYQGREGIAENYVGRGLTKNGFQIEKMELADGQVKLKGTRPLTSLEPWLRLVR